jgi:hypothetical protein
VTGPAVERPRALTAALSATIVLGVATLAFRAYVGSVAWDHGAEAASPFLALEACFLGLLPIVFAALAFRPSRISHYVLRGLYVLEALDAVAWLVLTPPIGGLLVIFASAGHGANAEVSTGLVAASAARWLWVAGKLAIVIALSLIVTKRGGEWLRACALDR